MATVIPFTTATDLTDVHIEPAGVLIRWERKNSDVFIEVRVADDGTYAWSSRRRKGGPITGGASRDRSVCLGRAVAEAAYIPERPLALVFRRDVQS